MREIHSHPWANRIVPACLLLALIACGGKKGGGDVTNPDINAAHIPKVTTQGGAGLDSKDSDAGSGNDICAREGDAYARFATYANQTRDYVYTAAKDFGFDALYTAKPITYTVADLGVMYTYYAQADLKVFGKLNAEIELKLAYFHAAVEKGEWKETYKDNSGLTAMLQARKSLFAFYSNIFGMTGYTWIEANDFNGEIAAAYKPFRDKVANDAALTPAQKAEIDYMIVEYARFSALRIDDKDFAIHTAFAGEKLIKVDLAPMATAFNYATYKKYADADYVAMKDRLKYYTDQITALETQYETTYKDKDTMQPAEFANVTATFQRQYSNLVAARDLVASFLPKAILGIRMDAQNQGNFFINPDSIIINNSTNTDTINTSNGANP